MKRELFVLVSASVIALGAACSSSSTTNTNTGTDSGVNTHPATDDSGATGDTDSGNADTDSGSQDLDSGVTADASLNGCGAFTDNTGKAEVDLTWDFSIGMSADRCSKVKVGSVVKWTGNFSTHPLTASPGVGDTPNPIGGTPDGGSIAVTFPTAGNFPYNCVNHVTQMQGVIQVVP